MQPLDQFDQQPANKAMDRLDRTTLYHLDMRPPLSIIEPRSLSRCLAVEQAIGTTGVEAQYPVTGDLKPNRAAALRQQPS